MRFFQILTGILFLTICIPASATHIRSGEIVVRRIDCNSNVFEITLVGYINTGSGVRFGGTGDNLYFGDGAFLEVPELTPQLVDALVMVGRVEFKITHTYEPGSYTISYTEANRNEGILNIESSVNTTLSIETYLLIEPGICNSTPYLSVPPIDRACRGITFYHNAGAVDPDDDSLSYELVTPLSNQGAPVRGYVLPTDRKFYDDYAQGNENNSGPPLLSIDPRDGTLSWDAPGAIGEYTVAIMINEWKLNPSDTIWYKAGYVVRDMQVIVEDCQNQKPDLSVPENYCVIAGNTIRFTALASDPDHDNVVIEAFSDVLNLAENPAAAEPANGVPQSTNPPNDTASITFTWNTTCAHIKEQPYQIILKVTDRPSAGPRLVRFKTVQIKVLAPPPEIKAVSINPITRQVVLRWEDYPCENVESFQVWRRVSEYEYEQPECNNGMPYFLRYKLLAELPGDVSGYTDNDLAIGAQYCYRIVARTGNNKTPSKISLDTCIIPKPAEAPVITHITVNQTNSSSGEILVRWTSPFDIDPIQYPPPYHYKVYRSVGLFENNPFELLTQTSSTDTTFVDVGANTQELPYQYKVELYVPSLTSLPVDTSSVASSVRLETISLPNSIALAWDANTPWYNYAQKFPYHMIYRSENMNNNFVLIDSVDVNESGFNYTDTGKFQNRNLMQGTDYYYKVLTRGTYGNPRIQQPLENFSQIMSSALLDTIPPCAPIVALEEIDCRTFSCTGSNYFNIIKWDIPDGDCGNDVASYKIYVSNETNTDFIPLVTSSENTYKHAGLNSRAKCYKISSVDYSGNESAMSDVVCFDNCPYFELPNIITPGNKDELNDFLSAFTAKSNDTTKCARFVVNIDVKIYDRWGGEVFSKNSITPEGGYILWDGLSNTGKEVSSGIYFYSANVQFDMHDPHLKFKKFTGWVHVVR